MKKELPPHPPRWAERFLQWYCRPELLEDLQGDLEEYFQRNLAGKGVRKARLIYMLDVLKFFRTYTVRSPKFSHPMDHLTLIRNYFKTAFRNLGKNKLFSGINVLGMAVSMSVGLLLIAFVTELKNFDRFHSNYQRIYKIINTYDAAGREPSDFASTSILAGKRIAESAPGAENVVILSRGFSKDLTYEGKTLPFSGLWASEKFFDLFSFELISGNAAGVLSTPRSVVLTASSAQKLFGAEDVTGRAVEIDEEQYTISGVMKDPPRNSHLQFDMLGSLITQDQKMQAEQNEQWLKWNNMWNNYVYFSLAENTDATSVQSALDRISEQQNDPGEKLKITMALQPLRDVVLSPRLSNQIGFHIDTSFIWILTGLAFVVIISACFNYTNLSVARALRRSREVGIRKVVGASRLQVFLQFILESILIAALALLFSFGLFLLIRPGFLRIEQHFTEYLSLRPSLNVYFYFAALAALTGFVAGFFPALFFSRVDAVKVIKDISKLKLFRHLTVRKALITFQFVLSICFIVAISIGYKQYQYSLNFDLGFTTDNILNVALQGNSPDVLRRELEQLPDITHISAASMVPSIGDTYAVKAKYTPANDSTTLFYNIVDENYLPLHQHNLLAGQNFRPAAGEEMMETEIIVNEKTLAKFGLGSPAEALGKELLVEDQRLQIIGVVQDFHFATLDRPIQHFAFRYDPKKLEVLNLKIASSDMTVTMDRLQAIWKKIDPVHPFEATFYDEAIQQAYSEYTSMIKIIGFLAVLAISIASLGLLGMVVFTTETRLREVSIRKVLGATEQSLIALLSRGFLLLLLIAGAISIPATYLLFDKVLFAELAFRAPLGFSELFLGALVVIGIALLTISSQTIRVARANPAEVLGSE